MTTQSRSQRTVAQKKTTPDKEAIMQIFETAFSTWFEKSCSNLHAGPDDNQKVEFIEVKLIDGSSVRVMSSQLPSFIGRSNSDLLETFNKIMSIGQAQAPGFYRFKYEAPLRQTRQDLV